MKTRVSSIVASSLVVLAISRQFYKKLSLDLLAIVFEFEFSRFPCVVGLKAF